MTNAYDDAEATASVPVRYTAELIRGLCYYLGTIRLDRGAQVVIEDYHREHLLEHGNERIADNDGEVSIKKRFKFRPYVGFEPAGTVVMAPPRYEGDDLADDVDLDRDARLRQFHAREQARLKEGSVTAPRFNPARDLVEDDEEVAEAPLAVIRRPQTTEVNNELTAREVVSAPRPRARTRT